MKGEAGLGGAWLGMARLGRATQGFLSLKQGIDGKEKK